MFQAVDKIETQADLTSFMKYLDRINSSEMQAVFFTMACQHKKMVRLVRNNPNTAKWAVENHELF